MVDQQAGAGTTITEIEANAIALLSNFNRQPVDRPSDEWLGLHCTNTLVREAGLWNSNHVMDNYDSGFLDKMKNLVRKSSILSFVIICNLSDEIQWLCDAAQAAGV